MDYARTPIKERKRLKSYVVFRLDWEAERLNNRRPPKKYLVSWNDDGSLNESPSAERAKPFSTREQAFAIAKEIDGVVSQIQ